MMTALRDCLRAVGRQARPLRRPQGRHPGAYPAQRGKVRSVASRLHPRRRLLPALAVLLCAAGHAATLPSWEFAAPRALQPGTDWICQTEVRDNDWFMRCDDLGAILDDDPVLQDTAAAPTTKLIPLHGAPFADSPLSTLAESVLCGGDPGCNVVVAAWQ